MSEAPFKPILLELLHHAHHAQDTFVQSLDAAERDATGLPDYWSAKDHIAHMTFWRQRLVFMLGAVLRHETPASAQDFEQLNPIIFERQRLRPWSEVLAESDQAYADLFTVTDQLSDDELTAFNRFDWIPEGEPLYTVFMGNCYEHAQQHFAQYALERHGLPPALRIYEEWAERVVQAEAPDALKGIVLYNLACFYSTHAELEKADTTLRQACTLYPQLKETARTDTDLIALRSTLPEAFS